MNHALLLSLITLVVGVVFLNAVSEKKPTRAKRPVERKPTVPPPGEKGSAEAAAVPNAPEYRRTPVMTGTERRFFMDLRAALPRAVIFPQVAMSALVRPAATVRSEAYMSAFGRIAQKRVDFAVCSEDLDLLVVVELDDRSHDVRKERDVERDSYLRSAGIRTVRFDVRRWPDATAIRSALMLPGTESVRPGVNGDGPERGADVLDATG